MRRYFPQKEYFLAVLLHYDDFPFLLVGNIQDNVPGFRHGDTVNSRIRLTFSESVLFAPGVRASDSASISGVSKFVSVTLNLGQLMVTLPSSSEMKTSPSNDAERFDIVGDTWVIWQSDFQTLLNVLFLFIKVAV